MSNPPTSGDPDDGTATSPDDPGGWNHALDRLDDKIRPNLRRAIPATVIAVLLFLLGSGLGGIDQPAVRTFHWFGTTVEIAGTWVMLFEIVVTVGFVIAAAVAAKSVSKELQFWAERRAGKAAGSAIRLITLLLAVAVIVIFAFELLRLDLRNLLVGGAITGIVLGIAAQQTLNNFFAGLVLFFARPYVPGQRVTIRSGAMGGPFTGVIVSAGMMYTLIDTDDEGVISMPNAGLMGSAISPAPPLDEQDDGDATNTADDDAAHPDPADQVALAAALAAAAAQLADAAQRYAATLPDAAGTAHPVAGTVHPADRSDRSGPT